MSVPALLAPRRSAAPPASSATAGPAPGLVASHIDKQQAPPLAPAQPIIPGHPDERQQEPEEAAEREKPQTRVAVYLQDLKISRQILRPDGTPVSRKGGGQRGAVTGLSRNSLRRFRFVLDNVRGLDYVLHLTYPQRFPDDGTVVKGHWKALREWLVRQGLGGVWDLEFQANGSPHFMVLLNGRLQKETVAARWAAIVGSETPDHRRAGTRVERVRNQHAIRNYMVKSVDHPQKQVPAQYGNVGRLWGCFGGVRAEPVHLLEGSRTELATVVRSLRKLEHAVRRKRVQARRGGDPGKALPRRDNGISGWTARGLAPAAGRCLERLATQLLERTLTPPARPRRSRSRGAVSAPSRIPCLIPCLVRHRLADWELLEDWLWAEWRRLRQAAPRRPARRRRRDRVARHDEHAGLAERRGAIKRLTARIHPGRSAGRVSSRRSARAGRPPVGAGRGPPS